MRNSMDRWRWRLGVFAAVCAGVFVAFAARQALAFDAAPVLDARTPPGEGPFWTRQRWSPYIVGVGIGVLSWLAFLLSDHPLGVSTAYARTAGMVEKLFRGRKVEDRLYYQEHAPTVDWEWMLVAGLLIGAAVSALTSGDFRLEVVPPLWEAAFGHTPVARLVVAFVGGWLIGFGARWARGCTSGHGISGALQLAVSSWVAAACFFVGGGVAAFVIYHVFA